MKKAPPADSLFSILRAENEHWLNNVFISLPIFERLKGEHSSILYGAIGSGKTAVRLALTQQNDEGIFTVFWAPEPSLEILDKGTALAQYAMNLALRACVESLILTGNLPKRLGEPSSHIASALQWFLRKRLPFDASFYIQSQADHISRDEVQWYMKLLEQSLPLIIPEQTSLKDQIRLLLVILRAAKYDRLWLMIDGLEKWTPHQAGEQVEALLEAILSTLVFFDVPDVTFKFFVPTQLKSILHKTSGVERHRAIESYLEWSTDELREMLEKRLTYALSSNNTSLASICDEKEFLSWIQEYGGTSPRMWLQFTAPLMNTYQKLGKRLTVSQTRDFIHQHPAPLQLYSERREVWLGMKSISINSVPEFRVLEYFINNPRKVCSLEELYYYAYKELNTVPDKGDHNWEHPKTWRGAMDTLIWRLRQKIEPDPKEPLYLFTHHGKGLELLHVEV